MTLGAARGDGMFYNAMPAERSTAFPATSSAAVERERLAPGERDRWLRWGPYLADRAWGTVREDYSADGEAWDFFSHDLARSKAYRWGEDGLAGLCDRYQVLCFALALWNERDPILKERAFGLVPREGNHGEDVKEYYFHLDAAPSHAYLKWLYKYPQRAFPYQQLVDENRARGGLGPEYELLDTGVFDEDRYFDVVVEYAQAAPEDIAIRVTVHNRGPEAAPLQLLPHLWFRNTWAWGPDRLSTPVIDALPAPGGGWILRADDRDAPALDMLSDSYRLGPRFLHAEADGEPLFCDNDTHAERVFGPGFHSTTAHPKDAFHRYVVEGEQGAVNPARRGTKACVRFRREVPAGGSWVVRLRLRAEAAGDAPDASAALLAEVDAVIDARRAETDAFYAEIHPPDASADERNVQRQALSALVWSKMFYYFDVARWRQGDHPGWPPPPGRAQRRNQHWDHLNSMRILLVCDKWEYPWFAAWDLAFHAVTYAIVDAAFAKEQLWLMLYEQFLHPSGQIPAYEWEFSDLNPPVHAWAVWRVYNMERLRSGQGDRAFLERCFHKLLLNFSFWVNKVDREGNNIFEGGFLGLDNITVLDRSKPLPHGARLEQSDGTGWMGMFCLQLMRMALELAKDNPVYEGLATKFFQHYVYVAAAMKKLGGQDYALWDREDGFFYDVLRFPDGHFERFRVRSLVGLIPLYAVERLEERWIEPFADFRRDLHWFLQHRRELVADVVHTVGPADGATHVLTIFDDDQLRGVLRRLCDPEEFMSPYGPRSLSRHHLHQPFRFGDEEVRYEPAESDTKLKGGNSNWRGPIWLPTSFLLIEALRKLGAAYGDDFRVPAHGCTGEPASFWQLAEDIANRLIGLFVRDAGGHRPVNGARRRFDEDPYWRDLITFHEYFHGETGEGLGAAHQTGWSSLVASLIDEWRRPRWGSSRS